MCFDRTGKFVLVTLGRRCVHLASPSLDDWESLASLIESLTSLQSAPFHHRVSSVVVPALAQLTADI